MAVPGGKPMNDAPGLTPRSPLRSVGPALVTVVPPRTEKLALVPSATDDAAEAGVTVDRTPARQTQQ